MTKFTKIAAWVGLGLALVLFVTLVVSSSGSATVFGNTYKIVAGQTYIDPYDFSGGLQVGAPTQASMRTLVRGNVCNPFGMTLPFVATTTTTFLCNDAYVTAGDAIDIRLPAPAASYGTFIATGSAFSTTTGRFGFTVMNMTGASTSSFPLATTSVAYSIYRTK